ncbi:hypothetical protein [Natronomonas sp.]|uniref:hypothetical protein n=1 Tax=Natronomonas sp. TaxID=2184060 RepID=UPI0039752E0E
MQAADAEFDDDATFLIVGPVPAEGRALVVTGARLGVVTLARSQLTRDGLR